MGRAAAPTAARSGGWPSCARGHPHRDHRPGARRRTRSPTSAGPATRRPPARGRQGGDWSLVTATSPHFMPGRRPARRRRPDLDGLPDPGRGDPLRHPAGLEEPLARPDGVPWPLVMWLQALLLAAVAAVCGLAPLGPSPDVDRLRPARRGPGSPGRHAHHRTAAEPAVSRGNRAYDRDRHRRPPRRRPERPPRPSKPVPCPPGSAPTECSGGCR
ncbi:hypothetical protein ACRAWF_20550 [Streptomyces sp. L7]